MYRDGYRISLRTEDAGQWMMEMMILVGMSCCFIE